MPARSRGERRTIEEIRRKYENKLPVMPRVYEVQTTVMKEHLPRMLAVTEKMANVYSVLDTYGVYGEYRIPYLNYARKLIHLSFRFKDEALRNAARVERARFEMKGLRPEVLNAIENAIGIKGREGEVAQTRIA